MTRTLVLIGIGCIVTGLLWPWLRTLPWGRLPGDIVIVRENFRFFFPLATSVVISVVVSLFVWLFRK